MKLIARLSLLQQTTRFKWIASAVVAALWLLVVGSLWVAANKPGAAQAAPTQPQGTPTAPVAGPLARFVDAGPVALMQQGAVAAKGAMRDSEGTLVVLGISGLAAAGMVFVVWLGLGLSYLALLVLGWGVAWPMAAWEPTARIGQIALGVVPLALFFMVLMQLLRLALSAPIPAVAVARNVLTEAVRMKVSLVFIVILILLMAVVPGMLNEDQPLRYRVQQWLSYGVGLSYVVLAMLTLFLSAATVAFEQRDRIIWQTMTKPVPHWQYVLGKWLGVMGLNAVLLTVSASGVYLFTEYLSHQRAKGEVAYLVRDDGARADPDDPMIPRILEARVERAKKDYPDFRDTPERRAIMRRQMTAEFMSEDRRILEFQVLAARRGLQPKLPEFDPQDVEKLVDERVKQALADQPSLKDDRRTRSNKRTEVLQEMITYARTVPPGYKQTFTFEGLRDLKSSRQKGELTLRWKVNAGSNNPSAIYRVLFVINGQARELTTALKVTNSLSIEPEIIDDDGKLVLEVHSDPNNAFAMNFPPEDGLELLYRVGGYEANFVRVMLANWIKLGFLAAVAIAAATFLNFPVACMVALTFLMAAESASFLRESLEYYVSYDEHTKSYNWGAILARAVAIPVSLGFRSYSELQPATSLVEGRLVSWGAVSGALALIGGWAAAALGVGCVAFRRRELAIYSGH